MNTEKLMRQKSYAELLSPLIPCPYCAVYPISASTVLSKDEKKFWGDSAKEARENCGHCGGTGKISRELTPFFWPY